MSTKIITPDTEFASDTVTAPNLDPSGNPDSLITLKDTQNTYFENVTTTGTVTTPFEVITVTGSNITRTLPDVSDVEGKRYKFLINNTAGTNYTQIQVASGDTIAGEVDGYRRLSRNQDSLELFSDGSDWYSVTRERLALAQVINDSGAVTIALTTTLAKINPTITSSSETVGRLETDGGGTYRLDVVEGGSGDRLYRVKFSTNISSTANKIIQCRLYKNGVDTTIRGGVELGGGGGGGRIGQIAFDEYIEANENDYFEIYSRIDSAANADFENIRFSLEMIER